MAGISSADPKHYKRDDVDIECIDVIRAVLGEERWRGYCAGNAMKYLWRMFDADRPVQTAGEDAAKAAVYTAWLADAWKKQKS